MSLQFHTESSSDPLRIGALQELERHQTAFIMGATRIRDSKEISIPGTARRRGSGRRRCGGRSRLGRRESRAHGRWKMRNMEEEEEGTDL
ncbi:hypothetical protein NL676_009960 [Syzygium grande]|nr:hypothetical protein NL676_009960 [Syzygium grande]